MRRTVIDFGRCFCSGSIALGALRSERSVHHCTNIKNVLQKFLIWSHNVTITSISTLDESPICVDCCTRLCDLANIANDVIPSVSGLCFSLADCASYSEEKGLRRIAAGRVDVLAAALDVRVSYLNMFENSSSVDISTYNDKHKYGQALDAQKEHSWFEEARRTGELFPGRPEIRPNVDFGATPTKENSGSCRKNYSTGKSHTTGIFTV